MHGGGVDIGKALKQGGQDAVFGEPLHEVWVEILHFGPVANVQDGALQRGAGATPGEGETEEGGCDV